jgi:hypothetical protein
MERDTIKAPDTEGSKPVLMLQPSELTLDSGTAPVEVAPPLGLARDDWVQPGGKWPFTVEARYLPG